MAATIKMSEAEERSPGFRHNRATGIPWALSANFSSGDWEAKSRFGSVRNVVVCDPVTGKPLFERPEYREAPNINAVAYGFDRNNVLCIAILHEVRPHADNPLDPADTRPLTFGQVPMGFLEKLTGKKFEVGTAGAIREVAEETGASAVIRVTQPAYPFHNPNPTFVATWSELYFIEVDIDKIHKLKLDHGEMIYKAEYIPVNELIYRIQQGTYDGAIYRAATSLSILMVFFATYPHLFPTRSTGY